MNQNSQTKKNKKPKRRFRIRSFGLRTLFVLILLVAGSLAYLVPKVEEAKQEKAALAQLLDTSWIVESYFDYQLDSQAEPIAQFPLTIQSTFGKNNQNSTPYGPWFIRKIFGELVFSRVDTVTIFNVTLPQMPGTNTTLSQRPPSDPKDLTFLKPLRHLRALHLFAFHHQETFDHVVELSSLQVLSMQNIESVSDISDISKLKKLSDLTLDKGGFKSVESLGQLSQLKKLRIENCPNTKDASALGELSQLEHLELSYNKSLNDFGFISKLKNLKSLTLKVYQDNQDFKFDMSLLANCKQLQKLELVNLQKIENSHSIKNLTSLKSVNIFGSHSLKSLDGFESLVELQELLLNENFYLNDIQAIRQLPNLTSLSLKGTIHLNNLEPIKDLEKLGILRIGGSRNLTELSPVKDLQELHQLDLANFPALRDLSALSNLNVDLMLIKFCPELTSLESLSQMPKLRNLTISECYGLKSLDGIAKAPRLKKLDILECDGLIDLSGLKELEKRTNKGRLLIQLFDCNLLTNEKISELELAVPSVDFQFR